MKNGEIGAVTKVLKEPLCENKGAAYRKGDGYCERK